MIRWLFESTAGLYAWMTSQRPWRQSCGRLAERLPTADGPLRIVDLGCGPGASTMELARRRPRDRVAGIDIAWRMLRRARRRTLDAGLPGRRPAWIHADVTRLPLRAESVDAVTGHSVLYLVDDRRAVLAECLRILRPGGRLVVMEPNERPVCWRDVLALSADPRFLLSIALWRPVSRLRGRFGPDSLAGVLRAAGFAHCETGEALSGLGVYACAWKAARSL